MSVNSSARAGGEVASSEPGAASAPRPEGPGAPTTAATPRRASPGRRAGVLDRRATRRRVGGDAEQAGGGRATRPPAERFRPAEVGIFACRKNPRAERPREARAMQASQIGVDEHRAAAPLRPRSLDSAACEQMAAAAPSKERRGRAATLGASVRGRARAARPPVRRAAGGRRATQCGAQSATANDGRCDPRGQARLDHQALRWSCSGPSKDAPRRALRSHA